MRAKFGRDPTVVSKKGSLKFISRYIYIFRYIFMVICVHYLNVCLSLCVSMSDGQLLSVCKHIYQYVGLHILSFYLCISDTIVNFSLIKTD